ncbi:DMT family transporter [Falsiroseomonas sp. HW251]|uniref:DMT family transporter n=1 Tax=Falsiroseomonas sp. HW251 TaxID=3390998 RepID=UPI003D320970
MARTDLVIGVAAALGAALVGAGWQVATRAALTGSTLAPLDLAVFRYVVPALVLLPVLLRQGPWPSTRPRWLALPLVAGGGLPFGLLAMSGASLAPVAHMGALMPGTMPVLTALLAAALLGERLRRRQVAGFGVVTAGVVLVSGSALGDAGLATLAGDALFLCAAMAWAVFGVAFRAAALPALSATALMSLVSSVLVMPLWLASGTERLMQAPPAVLLQAIAMQGLVAGLLGVWTYAVAVRRLGAAPAALSGAAVPALSAAGGWLLLDELPALPALAGIALTMAGLVLAAPPGIIRRPAFRQAGSSLPAAPSARNPRA